MTGCRSQSVAGVVAVLAGVLLASAAAADGGELPTIGDVRVGFAGSFKVGRWAPVAVDVAGADREVRGRLHITSLDGDGVPTRLEWTGQPPTNVPAGKKITLHAIVKTGRLRSRLRVEFVCEDGRRTAPAEAELQATPASGQLIVTLSDDLGITDLRRPSQDAPDEATVVAVVDRADDLPDFWLGYDGVDLVTLTTARDELHDHISDRQLAALETWVRMGGRLVLSSGSRGAELFGPHGRWDRLLPGRFGGVISLRDTTGLETFAEAGRVDRATDGQRRDLMATVVEDIAGRIEVFEGTRRSGRPIVIRAAHGLGQIVFVAVDLDKPPLSTWEGRPQLVEQLLTRPSVDARNIELADRGSGRAAHVGYRDLVGQLRAALDQFAGVRILPFSVIAALVVLYIALIGPIDYLWLRRFTRRMEWTWLTFSLIAVVMCLAAWWLAVLSKGNQARANQLALVDVDMTHEVLRGTVWAHLYTPKANTFDLRLQVDPQTDLRVASNSSAEQGGAGQGPGDLLSWLGLPGRALGGMDRTAHTDLPTKTYVLVGHNGVGQRRQMTVSGMPLNAASSKSLVGRWWGRADVGPPEPLGTDGLGMLAGSITNPLPIDLDECVLFYDRWAYSLGRMDTQQRVRLDETRAPRNVETLLQQRRIEDMKDITTPWDRSGSDVPRVLQMVMFHEAAGGRAYTGLLHRYQGEIDLSDHLQLDRAVLVGRAQQPAVRIIGDGPSADADTVTRHWTYYRIVFPVSPSGR
jgi:hypothetical protein